MTPPLAGWFPLLLMLASVPAERSTKTETVTLSGKVVELTAALTSKGVKFDPEPIAKQVVLVAQDDSVTPLLSDDASRALFLDKRLRDRTAEIQARRLPGLPYIQVLSFRILVDGKFQTPEYYCEICAISVRYPQTCPCCQGAMVLRMRPEPP